MEARISRILAQFLLILAAIASIAAGDAPRNFSYPTKNFVVYAPSPQIAQQVAIAAEKFRKELAIEWLGHELPNWSAPCPIKVKVGQIGAGGATTFSFHPVKNGPAEVCGWDMQIQGSLERILDSVLPHEVSHTIFACHFRRPLPRWADEGAATLVEHESERRTQVLRVQQVVKTRRRIPLKNLLSIKEYPSNMEDVMTLYAEGYSLAELLVQKGGKTRYLKFINDAHQNGWEKAIQTQYGYQGVDDLEKQWHEWIIAGSPELPEGQMLAQNGDKGPGLSTEGYVLRGQSPDATHADGLAEDPFLDGRPVVRTKPKAPLSGELASRPRSVPRLSDRSRKPQAELDIEMLDMLPEGLSSNEAWDETPDDVGGVVHADLDGEKLDDGNWVDVPRSRIAEPASPSRAAVVGSNFNRPRPGEMKRSAPRETPSVARQRQTPRPDLRADRLAGRASRLNSWSETPVDPRPSPFRSTVE